MNPQALMLMQTWGDKIPKDDMIFIQSKLKELDSDKLQLLYSVELKSPIIGLVLGLLVGMLGVDRFYKGDIGLGIAKLCLCWLTFGIWNIIDLFLVWKGIKKDNLKKISQQLMIL